MAFLTDITLHLNHLNILLQGRDQTVCDLYAHMTAFQRKLNLFKEGFASRRPNLPHFPACEELRKSVPECEKLLHKYGADIEKLQKQFKDRFQDFHVMQPRIALFTDLLSAAVSEQRSELQLNFILETATRGTFSSAGILLSQWPACLGAHTFVRAVFQQ